jgi:hypothetical protein
MTDRRFSEEEVATIFRDATEASQGQRRDLPSGEGMTLAQLQEIGREVGISPDLVRRAALSLDQLGQPNIRRFVGLPIGVGRTVDLGRTLTDQEWERLVVDMRQTFDAKGIVRQDGSFRQWTNGNLQALVEPTATGHQVRLRTTNANARSLMMLGFGATGIGAIASISAAVSGAANMAPLATLTALGVGLFVAGAARLPGWARRRREQMEAVAGRLGGGVEE